MANYRYLGAAKVGSKLGLQQLTVQVGNLNNAAMGKALPVTVSVNGVASNADNTFTPNPGRILFVAQNGNDSTAVPGDITKPYRYLQTASNGGAAGALRAGDHIVIRGGNWTDTGFDGAWLRFRYSQQQGSAPTGASGTGWIHITAYPGQVNGNAIEDVHYSTPAGVKGGFQGAGSAYFGTTGDWISISNLRMDVNANATSDAAPINLQYSGGPWRIVNNELGPWPSAINSKAGGVSGHGTNTKVLGNHIYGMACTGALENHGVYADSGASGWEIAYNYIHDITGGNSVQFFDNEGLAGTSMSGYVTGWKGFANMKVHHNYLDGSGKHGLNLSDSTLSAQIYDNVVMHAKNGGLRLNTNLANLDITVAYNTFYENDLAGTGAQVMNTWGGSGALRVYDNVVAAGPKSPSSSRYYTNQGGTDTFFDFKRNLYWDNGYGWASFTRDTLALKGNPLFASASTGNLNLTASSPAIQQATQAISFTVADDVSSFARPNNGKNDLGAFQLH
ncbi:hypothetical protein E4K72_13200 [Oxalobacteraceae bacterium OM1]|nr:hypothetical protein E4K72_13200 [Oxalobacteraceae bacterium OM1]